MFTGPLPVANTAYTLYSLDEPLEIATIHSYQGGAHLSTIAPAAPYMNNPNGARFSFGEPRQVVFDGLSARGYPYIDTAACNSAAVQCAAGRLSNHRDIALGALTRALEDIVDNAIAKELDDIFEFQASLSAVRKLFDAVAAIALCGNATAIEALADALSNLVAAIMGRVDNGDLSMADGMAFLQPLIDKMVALACEQP
jgi:hypothetical protein